jgi:hypothetical protein
MSKEVRIFPDSESILNKNYCLKRLEEIADSTTVFLKVDSKNKHFLLLFGMLFNVLHYFDNKKYIVHWGRLELTSRKSFNNLAQDLIFESAEMQPKYKIDNKKSFMTSPVRSKEDELTIILRNLKNKQIEQKIFDYIHYPIDDTNQDDNDFHAARRICIDNIMALAPAGTNQIYYKTDSFGSVFDTGEYFSFRYLVDKETRQKKIRRMELINDKVIGVNHIPNDISKDPYFEFLKILEKNEK